MILYPTSEQIERLLAGPDPDPKVRRFLTRGEEGGKVGEALRRG